MICRPQLTAHARAHTHAGLKRRANLWIHSLLSSSLHGVPALPWLPPLFTSSRCISWHVFNIKTGRCCEPTPFSLLLPCRPGQHGEACEKVMLALRQERKKKKKRWRPLEKLKCKPVIEATFGLSVSFTKGINNSPKYKNQSVTSYMMVIAKRFLIIRFLYVLTALKSYLSSKLILNRFWRRKKKNGEANAESWLVQGKGVCDLCNDFKQKNNCSSEARWQGWGGEGQVGSELWPGKGLMTRVWTIDCI